MLILTWKLDLKQVTMSLLLRSYRSLSFLDRYPIFVHPPSSILIHFHLFHPILSIFVHFHGVIFQITVLGKSGPGRFLPANWASDIFWRQTEPKCIYQLNLYIGIVYILPTIGGYKSIWGCSCRVEEYAFSLFPNCW